MIERTHHGYAPYNAREALLSIHVTRVKHRELRTRERLDKVEKNRFSEFSERQYNPGDRVDFFKNTVNPQRTCGVVIEQVLDKQNRIRYGDDQHIKVATKSMVPVMDQGTEANPVEVTVDTEDIIEEDTGSTQQFRVDNPLISKKTLGTDQEGTEAWLWPDEVSNSEYPGQQDHQVGNPEENSLIVSNPAGILEESQSDIYDPDEQDDTGYPDTLELGTDLFQDSEQTECPGAAHKGTSLVAKEPSPAQDILSGSDRITRGKNKPGGTKDDGWGKYHRHPFRMSFRV